MDFDFFGDDFNSNSRALPPALVMTAPRISLSLFRHVKPLILDLSEETLLKERGQYKKKTITKFQQNVLRNSIDRRNKLGIGHTNSLPLPLSVENKNGLLQIRQSPQQQQQQQLQTLDHNPLQVLNPEHCSESTTDNSIDESTTTALNNKPTVQDSLQPEEDNHTRQACSVVDCFSSLSTSDISLPQGNQIPSQLQHLNQSYNNSHSYMKQHNQH